MRLRRVAAPAWDGLRTYRGTTLLLVAACAAGLAVMLPATAAVTPSPSGLESTVVAPPVHPSDFGLVWGPFAQSPTDSRQAAVVVLVRMLLGVAAAMLAVTWFTTLSVSTARASGRAVEVAVRRAVGASRWHLLGAALLEGSALALLALVIGGGAGVAAAHLSLAAWPGAVRPGSPLPGLAAVAATMSGIVLGALLPMVYARRSGRIQALDPTPLGLLVPAVQLGVSLTVLTSASLLDRGAARLAPGAGPRVESGQVFEIAAAGVAPAVRAARYGALLRRIHGEPAVGAASLGSPGALAGLGQVDIMVTHCGECWWSTLLVEFHTFYATHFVASADSFRALGMRLVAGRWFTDDDGWRARRVAVVSRWLAERHFQQGDAVGRMLHVGHGSGDWYTVIGVVEDRPAVALGGPLEPREAVYLSVLQHPPTAAQLLVRAEGSSVPVARIEDALRDTLGPGAAAAPLSEADLLAAEAAPIAWFARMFGREGWALLAVATAGTFAMMWLWVTSLLGELGVRRAVGARRRSVMGYVLARALLVAAGGAVFGAWLGLMVWDALGGAVSGLPAWDPLAVLRYGLLLGAAALAGALLPAWRAAHASPTGLLSGGM